MMFAQGIQFDVFDDNHIFGFGRKNRPSAALFRREARFRLLMSRQLDPA
jgi:hypothetical protein